MKKKYKMQKRKKVEEFQKKMFNIHFFKNSYGKTQKLKTNFVFFRKKNEFPFLKREKP